MQVFVYQKFRIIGGITETSKRIVQNGSIVINVELKMDKLEGIAANVNGNVGEGEEKLPNIECAICYESFQNKEISSVKCGHIFCTVCITRSIETRKNCPKCNAPATVEDLRRTYVY